MKATIFIIVILLLIFISGAGADTVYLKNGRELEGIITEEANDYLTLSVGIGSVKFYSLEVDHILRSNEAENKTLKGQWQKERVEKEEELQRLRERMENSPKEISVMRVGNHLFLDALLNGKINAKLMLDTGASFVLLSPEIARELGIDIKIAAPDIKTTLADGSEVPAKLFRLDTVSIQGIEAKDIDAVVLFKDKPFEGFDGLLGMTFLKLFKFEINLEKDKLVLQRP